MFVYVSDLCWQDAKTHQIEDKINELKQWIEQGDFYAFTKQFEIFKHPYYVRKKLAYSYRLLARHTEVVIDGKRHGVVVFFQLFHRQSTGYDDFYFRVSSQGDMLYNQQKLNDKVVDYVKSCLNNNQKAKQNQALAVDEATALAYFFKARVNLFHFEPCPPEYYHETVFWRYDLAPKQKAGDDLVFANIQQGINTEQIQTFSIQDTLLSFIPGSIPTLSKADAKQSPFDRKLPVEFLLDQSLWQLARRGDRLFDYLNPLGCQVCEVIFSEGQAFPLIVNAPNLHGKSSLLSLLAIHYHYQDDPNATGLPCLLIVSNNTNSQFINSYLDYQGSLLSQYLNIPKVDINNGCFHPLTLLNNELQKNANWQFKKEFYIDEREFEKLWQNCSLSKQTEFKYLTASFIWYILQYHIKGGYEFDGTCNYSDGELFELIYQKVYQDWYKTLMQDGYWDLHDLCYYFNDNDVENLTYKAILIDDCHSYSKLMIYTLLKHSAYYQNGKLFFQSPIIFMGDTKHNPDWQTNIDAVLSYIQKQINYQDTIKTKKLNHNPQFISNLDDVFSYYESLIDRQLNPEKWQTFDLTIQHKIQSNNVINKLDKPIYFVNSKDNQAILALLSNYQIDIYSNHQYKNDFDYFVNHPDIGHLFALGSNDIFCKNSYTQSDAIMPAYQIALFGFCKNSLFDFLKNIDELTKPQLEQALFLLNLLEKNINNSLNAVFIVGNDDELQKWQQFFDDTKHNIIIKTARADDINLVYQTSLDNLHQKRQEKLKNLFDNPDDNMIDLINVSAGYLDLHQYKEFLDTLFQTAEINGNFDSFIEELVTENQKEYGFRLLWKYKYQKLWLEYADYCPKSMLGNLLALQLLHQENTGYPVQKAYQLALQSYFAQYQDEQLVNYWKSVINLLLEQLRKISVHEFHLIDDALSQLAEHKYYLPFLTVADIYYQYKYFDKAMTYWQLSEYYDLEVPDTYYELCITMSKNWIYTLIPLLQLDRLGEFMNTIEDNDVNQLRLEHWEKILPYLIDHPDVEMILNALLPQIRSVEVLNKILEHCQYDVGTRFVDRLQRLLTLNACLVGDWQMVNDRLAHYVPADDAIMEKLGHHFLQTQIKQGKTVSKKTVIMPKFNKPQDEVIDIIYALNLHSEFILTNDWDEYNNYCQKPHIRSIFANLRKIFSVKVEGSDWERQWNSRFPAVRALAFLLEKSDSTLDAQALYNFIAHDASNKDTLKNLAIERNRLLLKRADRFATLDKQAMLEQANDNVLSDNMEQALLVRWGDIPEMQKELLAHFSKELEKYSGQDELVAPEPIKSIEELINNIMTLNDKEQRELKELEKEQRRLKKEAQERVEQERLEQERAEKERLKAEKAEQERLEQERLEQERLEQERLEQERLEQERLEQERLEQERLEQERLEQERLEQEQTKQIQTEQVNLPTNQTLVNQAIIHQTTINQATMPIPSNIGKPKQQAVSELNFFGFRIFVARLFGRVNIEYLATGERCSLFADGTLQSDWAYQVQDNAYYFVGTPLVLTRLDGQICLTHSEHGITLTV